MQPLSSFLKICNLCIAITINLLLPMSRCCLEVVGISKHLVWCCIFGKCQNLGGSDKMYYAATIQFFNNVQFVHSNYHKLIFANEQMMFEGCRNFKTSSLVLYFWKMSKFRWNCNYHKFIFANEQMMFGGCRNFKTSSLVSYFWKISKFRWKL